MPLYRYSCLACVDLSFERFLPAAKRDLVECPRCGESCRRLASQASVSALETLDQYRNKKAPQDIKKKIEDRAMDNFYKEDLPNIIREHGKEFAQRNGWIDQEGRVIKKG